MSLSAVLMDAAPVLLSHAEALRLRSDPGRPLVRAWIESDVKGRVSKRIFKSVAQ